MDFFTEHPLTKEYVMYSFRNWDYNRPVVYLLRGNKSIYIGETTNAFKRMNTHLTDNEKKGLDKMVVLYDAEYNKSATLDIESKLIQYFAAEEHWFVKNKNDGIRDHNYFDREKYLAKFERIWQELRERGIVYKKLEDIQNSDLFKYSPYKALNFDQYEIVSTIFDDIKSGIQGTYMITGEPGTGKSVVASYLIKFLRDQKETKHLRIGLVVPMASLRKTFKKVFKNIDGLNPSMVIGPNDLAKDYNENNLETYDIIIVDESHRLQQRKNITNYKSYDDVNKKLGFSLEMTQLDRVKALSKTQILLYDKNQSIKPADVNAEDFKNLTIVKHYTLKSQMRVKGGNDYLTFVGDLFDGKKIDINKIQNYDFKIYDDFSDFRSAIIQKDKEHGLSRIVAGYARPWKSKKNLNHHDIEIDGIKMFWNATNIDWVNSDNALNEIGCIHTVQGYDLNYVGVIIGEELSYDASKGGLYVKNEKYYDKNGKNGIKDYEELRRYILNIYKTLFTRGIEGTYVYVVDEKLREYIKQII